MKKLFLAAVVVATVAPLAAAPQRPQPSPPSGVTNVPGFEVVSVKVNRSGADRQDMRLLPGGRIVVTNAPLRRLVLGAYELLPQQLFGGPGWIDSDRFDIVAQANENLGPPVPGGPPGRMQLMLQRLLAERFGLAVHTETRELPIYELTLARADGRLAPGISPAKFDCTALFAATLRGEAPMPPTSQCGGSGMSGRIVMRGATMPMFVPTLSGLTGRIVQDHSGLSGGFDFALQFAPESEAVSGSSAPSGSASLFTALEEQLGLKLRPARGWVEVVVIDRVDHPTED